MYARSTMITAVPASIDAGIAQLRDDVMPRLVEMEGCIGLSMMVDRETGRCIATSAWQSEEAMRATDDALRPIRDRLAETLGGEARTYRSGRSPYCIGTTDRPSVRVSGPPG